MIFGLFIRQTISINYAQFLSNVLQICLQNKFCKQIQSSMFRDSAIRFKYEEKSITIDIAYLNSFDKYKGVYFYNNLPIEFRVIFQNIEQFFAFLNQSHSENMKVKEDKFCIMVEVAGKTKQFQLPLQKIELTLEQKLSVELKNLRAEKQRQSTTEISLRQAVKDVQSSLQQKQAKIAKLHLVLNQKERQYDRLTSRYYNLQSNMEQLLTAKVRIPESGLRDANLSEEHTVAISNFSKSNKKKLRAYEQPMIKVDFKVDQTTKCFSKFKINDNIVQKLENLSYQLVHCEGLTKTARFYFDTEVVKINNGNFVVGVVSDKNKGQMFSRGQSHCFCYNGLDGSIWQGEKQRLVKFKAKDGVKIRTVINLSSAQIQWFNVKEDSQNLIGKISSAEITEKQGVFPFLGLEAEGSVVKLNP